MRVDRKDEARKTDAAPREPFKQVLSKQATAKGPLAPGGVKVHTQAAIGAGRAAVATTQVQKLLETRSQGLVQVQERVEQRVEGLEANREKLQSRALELIRAELNREHLAARQDAVAPPPVSPARDGAERNATKDAGTEEVSSVSGASSQRAAATEQAQADPTSAIELVERIELFVRSSRPGLALDLQGPFARVEVERTGKGQVALTVQGRGGPPDVAALRRLRDELQLRGIEVSALVAR